MTDRRPVRYGSVCSGVGSCRLASVGLDWDCAFFAEIEPFPSAVLAHHFPEVPNHGDFTQIGESAGPVDVLVGGTPCQSFSVAGKRAGLDSPNGNLAIEFARLAQRLRARWIVWENVPGVLSSVSDDGSSDFDTFLGVLEDVGYSVAWTVLDAQYFGVPQRRRRVFVVGYLGDWRPPAAVLFEPESLRGHSAPEYEAGKDVAGTLGGGAGERGWSPDTDRMTSVAFTASDYSTGAFESSKSARGLTTSADRTRSAPIVAFSCKDSGDDALSPTLRSLDFDKSHANGGGQVAVAFDLYSDGTPYVLVPTMNVRRLTPRECERLQGYPDDWTLAPYRGKPAADGPRYRAIGNGWAVPVVAWIFRRLDAVEREL